MRTYWTTGVLVAACSVPAAAGAPAVIHGHVYDCAGGLPVSGARVALRLPSGANATLEIAARISDARGNFTIIGLAPGTYVLAAAAAGVRDAIPGATEAQRRLTIDDGDALGVAIGVSSVGHAADVAAEADLSAVRPICDAAIVPRAIRPEDLYVIH